MNILLISPLAVPITPQATYAGIERLVWVYSKEFLALSHNVTVICHPDSVFPADAHCLRATHTSDMAQAEIAAYQLYQGQIRGFDAIIDFSHLHLASRLMANLPSANIFWHAPSTGKYPKAPYNIIAPSQWAAREFRRVYGQDSRVMRVIAIDPNEYCYSGAKSDRFLAVGRNDPEKGNINAIRLCHFLDVKLDIIAARGLHHGDEPLTPYEKEVMEACDGDQIRFLGDVATAPKIELMQAARGLIYITDHEEVTNHKAQECMMCGAPAIMNAIGAAQEIVIHGETGYLGRRDKDWLEAIENIDKIDRRRCSDLITQQWNKADVVRAWIPLLEEVAGGARW